jgi:hypothetical protein
MSHLSLSKLPPVPPPQFGRRADQCGISRAKIINCAFRLCVIDFLSRMLPRDYNPYRVSDVFSARFGSLLKNGRKKIERTGCKKSKIKENARIQLTE